ncbi:MAG: hypothetical protein ACP5QA_15325 [Phycisphaerae bacterium]
MGTLKVQSGLESGDVRFQVKEKHVKENGVFWGRLYLKEAAPIVGINYLISIWYVHIHFSVTGSGNLNVFKKGDSEVLLDLGIGPMTHTYGDLAGGAMLEPGAGAFSLNDGNIAVAAPFGCDTYTDVWDASKTVWFSTTTISIELNMSFDKAQMWRQIPGLLPSTSITLP